MSRQVFTLKWVLFFGSLLGCQLVYADVPVILSSQFASLNLTVISPDLFCGDQRLFWDYSGQPLKIQVGVVDKKIEFRLGKQTLSCSKSKAYLQSHGLRKSLQKWPDKVHFQNESQKWQVLAHVPWSQYVEVVLASEMPASWPLEALKAQAVAVRSYALSRLTGKKDSALLSSVLDQVFDREKYWALPAKYKKNVERAVKETKGQWLIDLDNQKPFLAHFHADCGGGALEDPSHVWPTRESVEQVGSCPKPKSSQWRHYLSKTDLSEKIYGDGYTHKLKKFWLWERTPSGRVKQLKLKNKRQVHYLGVNDLREKLGFFNLKSARFTVQKKKKGYLFEGVGFGHGVGLCQRGAKYMAEQGREYREILRQYYPKAVLFIGDAHRLVKNSLSKNADNNSK